MGYDVLSNHDLKYEDIRFYLFIYFALAEVELYLFNV